MTPTFSIKCGCGHRNPISRLDAEAKCSNCQTPLIYENPPTSRYVRTLTVSRQCDLMVTLDSTPATMTADARVKQAKS